MSEDKKEWREKNNGGHYKWSVGEILKLKRIPMLYVDVLKPLDSVCPILDG